MRCYLFDIDGTLADIRHRLHFIIKPADAGDDWTKNWDAFFDACVDDEPIEHMCRIARTLRTGTGTLDMPQPVIFVSGRSDRVRKQTLDWLNYQGLFGPLCMRKDGDHRQDYIVKLEILDDLRKNGYEPIMAFDDRKQVVDMWRANGVPCAQVAEGDF